MDPAYIIPSESSIVTFHATEMNFGSGDWWIYGEDANRYYHFVGEDQHLYDSIKKVDAAKIANFNPHDVSTWNK